ncbi:hypothetical protein B7463_g5817, partial [Scytalidium lignicola]
MDLAGPVDLDHQLHDHSEQSTSVPPDASYTNPDTTKTLWEEVELVAARSCRGHEPSSGGHQPGGWASRTDPDDSKISPLVSVPQSLFDFSESQATPESAVANTMRTMSSRSSKFTKLVLHPRGIIINDTSSIVPSAFSHFGTSEPLEGKTIDYKGIAGLSGTNIWVILGGDPVKDIATEYSIESD